MTARRIYLDNAATSWPKPEAVYAAVDHYQRHVGAAHGRGAYAEAVEVSRGVERARAAVAGLMGCQDARHVVFTLNCTDSLNTAIYGSLRPGDHVVTTVLEHNSILRPLRHLEDAGTIEVTRVGCDGEGVVDPDAVRAALRSNTKLVAILHASNVTGAVQPIAEISRTVREHAALVLLDAAQTLGHLPIDVGELGIDLLAASGHKGLLGPLGTGVLYIRPGVETQVASLRQGGTGSASEIDRQPDELPDKYEAGNHNVPGLLGVGAGAAYLAERGLDELRRHEQQLTARLIEGLTAIRGVTIYGPRDPDRRVGVVSINLEGYDPQELAATLEAGYRIQVRAGLHCAPRMHEALGTLAGGTVRFSLGPFNTDEDVAAVLSAVEEISAASLPV